MKKISITVLAILLFVLTGTGVRAQSGNDLYSQALVKEKAGNHEEAIKLYQSIVQKYAADTKLAAKSLFQMGQAYEKLANAVEARKAYEKITRDFPDQKVVAADAQKRLAFLNGPEANRLILSRVSTGSSSSRNQMSPDGRYWVGRARTGLLIREVSSGKDRFLGPTDNDNWSPTFTPDSKRIVYTYGKDGVRGALMEIRVINIDGSGEKTIWKSTEHLTVEVSAISPDGKLAAVNLYTKGGRWESGVISLETGSLKTLTTRDWPLNAYVGNFSPDGRWLVYASEASKEPQDGALYTLAVDGSGTNTLMSRYSVQAAQPPLFFTPDGSSVVFVNREVLYSIRVAEGKSLGGPEIVNVSSVGNLMGFTRDGSLYYVETKSQASVYVAEVDASTWKLRNPPKEISTPFRRPSGQPAWSRDGKLLAFEDNGKLIVHDFDTGRERELFINGSFKGWYPDGKSVLLSAPLPAGVRVFDLETQRERPLVLPDTAASNLQISGPVINSTDGKYLFYFTNDDTEKESRNNGTVHLIRRDLQTNDEKELYRFEGERGFGTALAVSPDGQNLSFSPGVTILIGNAPRRLPLEGSLPLKTWTQDGKALLFVRSNEIWVQPVDGGPAYWTGIQVEGLYPPNLHPDGNRIAFLGRKNSSTVWKLQNLFPVAAKK